MTKASTNTYISLLFSLSLALTCGIFLYSANSPLGPSYGSDNAIYMTMGTALAHGYRPYVDIFDHKGPVLFLLQWFPQCLGNGYQTLPIFMQEILFLFLCLRVLSLIARNIFHRYEIIIQLVYLCFISSLVSEGNLTEEYSNHFILIALFAIFKFLNTSSFHDNKTVMLTSLVIGLCFSICFLIRANNALPLAGFILGILVTFLFSHEYHTIGLAAIGFLSGCLIVCIPIGLWLIANQALSESIQASIIHNFLYSETTSIYTAGRLNQLLFSNYGHMALFFFSICFLASILYFFKNHSTALSLGIFFSGGFALIAAFISHKYYDHYLIIGAPLSTLSAIYLLSQLKGNHSKVAIAVCLIPCIAWLAFQCLLANTRRLSDNKNLSQFLSDTDSLISQIPVDELSQVYPYRVEPKLYVAAHILPYNRYYFLQEILAEANPAIMDEIVNSFNTSPPLWLILFSKDRAFSPPYDTRIQEIIDTQYEECAEAGTYRLLRLSCQ